MTLVQRTVASFAGVLLLMLLACAYVLQGLWQLGDAAEEQWRIAQAAEHAQTIDAASLRAILLLEQYVDIPDRARLDELRAVRREAAERRQALRAATSLARIRELLDAYEALQPQRVALAEAIVEAAGSDASTLVKLRQQRDALDRRVRGYVAEIVAIEQAAMAQAARRAHALGADLRRTTIALFGGIVALTLLIAVRSARGVSRRVVPLLDMARKVSRGDFSARVPVHGKDEVATLSETLNHMASDLEELDRAKDEFVALASHQLRTPATAVKGNLAMLLDGYFGEVRGEQREFLQDAYDANERQMEVIDAILNVARAETGRLGVEPSPTELVALVDAVVAEHRHGIAARRQRLDWQAPAGPLTLALDAAKIRMVVDNLVSNASKYTPEGGAIRVALAQQPEGVVLEVSDDGVGIAAEDRERLFRKFSRIDNPLSVAAGGTGLGLYLAGEIVRLHGGGITVQSEPGKGSTFRCDCRGGEPMARVLIVEDNAALQKIYVTLLTKEGHEVEFANDGRQALEKANTRTPDLILLDMMMPNLDGIGFLRAFDLKGKHPGVKVVVFSNTEMPAKVKEALELGASRYMTKYNMTPKDMVAAVRELLAR